MVIGCMDISKHTSRTLTGAVWHPHHQEVERARKIENMKSDRMTLIAEGSCVGGMYLEKVGVV